MLNALVLYRFSNPAAERCVTNLVLPGLLANFRVFKIRAQSNDAGTLNYWLHAFEIAQYLVDIVVSVELSSDRFSHNIIHEQLSNRAQNAAGSMKQTMLANCMQAVFDGPRPASAAEAIAASPRELAEFGQTYFVKLTDMPRCCARAPPSKLTRPD
jgi:hypothetical protein